jgi:hypothetical protein
VGPTVLGDRGTVIGLAALIVDQELSPESVDRLVSAAITG